MPNFVYYLYLIPLTASTVVSLRSFKNQWAKPYRYFSLFLMATLTNELFAISWKFFLHHNRYWDFPNANLWIYNIYLPPQYLFYFLFFSLMIDEPALRKMKKTIMVGYLIFCILNITFFQSIKELNTYTIIVGNALVIGYSITYFIHELNRQNPLPVQRQSLFWISLGAFVFNTVSLPYFISINYLSRNNLPLAVALFNILLILNILMYICYLIAFLCKTPSPRKPS
ncbi:hypothetical protein SAMN03159284_04346 [Mucilaginibacter sp. NFR10]|nr:hypothetical protein SAMN03159284_04346 [Mucilaginibacter sp. NFR10]